MPSIRRAHPINNASLNGPALGSTHGAAGPAPALIPSHVTTGLLLGASEGNATTPCFSFGLKFLALGERGFHGLMTAFPSMLSGLFLRREEIRPLMMEAC